ncbi:50S ribosomal protein L13 [archaeon]|nr:50S ribosomal protein L13 [archaeon]
MEKIYVDADMAIVGRLGTFVAKQLLRGSEVVVINSEKAIISGNSKMVVDNIRTLRQKGGSSQKGPKFPKLTDRLLKRMIRGMLPWDRAKGRDAFKRLRCFEGNPLTEEEQKKVKKLEMKVPAKYTTLKKVIELI